MKTAAVVTVTALCTACMGTVTRQERVATAARERTAYCDDEAPRSMDEVLGAVQQVDPLVEVIQSGRQRFGVRLVGAQLSVRALRGITAQWLERTLQCHQAQKTLDPSGTDADPFWLPDGWVQLRVRPVQGGFVAELRGANGEDAEQIYSRAQELMARTTASN